MVARLTCAIALVAFAIRIDSSVEAQELSLPTEQLEFPAADKSGTLLSGRKDKQGLATEGLLLTKPQQGPTLAAPGVIGGGSQPAIPLVQLSPRVVLRIEPKPALQAEQLVYRLFVENQGQVSAEDCFVEVRLPEGLTFASSEPSAEVQGGRIVWEMGSLPKGSKQEIELSLINQSFSETSIEAQVSCRAKTALSVPAGLSPLEMQVSHPARSVTNNPVPVKIQLTNSTNRPLSNLLLNAQLPATLKHPAGQKIEYEVGTLQPGKSREVTLNVVPTSAGLHSLGIQAAGDPKFRVAQRATLQVAQPAVSIEKSGPTKRFVGRPATYSITVRNPASVPMQGLVIRDQVPEGMRFVQATFAGVHQEDEVRWAIPELAPGESRQLSVTFVPEVAGTFVSQAVATAQGKIWGESSAKTVVEGLTALSLKVVDLQDPVADGEETTYEVRVINQGSESATNLRLSLDLPKGFEVVNVKGPTAFKNAGGTVLFEPLAQLSPRADAGYFISVRTSIPGDRRFAVQLICDQLDKPVRSEESTRVYADD